MGVIEAKTIFWATLYTRSILRKAYCHGFDSQKMHIARVLIA